MAVSEADRAHMARIAAYKEASRREAAVRLGSLSPEERIRLGWAIYLKFRGRADLSRRDDDPSPFFERARRLGMIRD